MDTESGTKPREEYANWKAPETQKLEPESQYLNAQSALGGEVQKQLENLGELKVKIETLNPNTPEAQLAMLRGPDFQKDIADFQRFIDRLSGAFKSMHNKTREQSVWDQRIQEVTQKGEIPDPTDDEWDPDSSTHSKPRMIDARAVLQMAQEARTRPATNSGEDAMLSQGAEWFNRTFDKYKLDFNFKNEVDNAVRSGNAGAVLLNSFEKARKAKMFELLEATGQLK